MEIGMLEIPAGTRPAVAAGQWITDAEPGQGVVYFSGWVEDADSNLMTAMRMGQEMGLVDLVQKRISHTEGFDYIAIRRKEPPREW